MTVHYIEPELPKPTQANKRKVLDVIALLKRGRAVTVKEIADHCDIATYSAERTLDLLVEYGLVRFAGKGPRAVGGGHQPATWRWE